MKSVPSVLASVTLVVCFFASVSPVFAQGGTITIVKNTDPDSSTSFNFTGDLGAFSASEGSPAVFTGLTDGTYSVTEQVATGYELNLISCSDPSGGTGVSPSTATAIIGLSGAESITCTFTNTELATVTIVKDAVPDGPQSFGFTGNFDDFSLTDDGSPANSQTFQNVSPTTYDVYEDAEMGWDLTSIVCVDPTEDSTIDLDDRNVYFDLSPGETVTCTFTNVSQQQVGPAIPVLSRAGIIVLVLVIAAVAVWAIGRIRLI